MGGTQSDGLSPCCGSGDCCVPGGDKGGTRNRHWKTLVFSSVMLLAGVVAAYSFFWSDRSGVDPACCDVASAGCATPCVADTAIAGFDDQLEGADFALVVFLPGGCTFPQQAADVLHEVLVDLRVKGVDLRTLYLTPASPAFAQATDRYRIMECPTLLVCAGQGRVVLARDEITRDSILSIYERTRSAIPAGARSHADQTR